jgi:formiminoglutamase
MPCGDIWDLGNLVCDGDELESAQEKLGEWVQGIIEAGAFPVILGGGHETAWGTYQGIGRVERVAKSLGIVNLDAHFDLRPVEDGKGTSGTPFSQIASACEKVRRSFHYTCVGIQSSGNTESLFSRAKEVGASYHLAEACIQDPERVVRELAEKMATVQNVYVSFCLDVIHASVAPGVSAPQGLGLFPWQVEPMLTWLIHSGKMVAFDMVELAPRFDPQGSTVRFAAEWVRKVVMGYFSQANGR